MEEARRARESLRDRLMSLSPSAPGYAEAKRLLREEFDAAWRRAAKIERWWNRNPCG
jgi:hypothetical protein